MENTALFTISEVESVAKALIPPTELKENFLQIHPDMIHRLMAVCMNRDVVKEVETHLRKFNKEYGAEARMVSDTIEKNASQEP